MSRPIINNPSTEPTTDSRPAGPRASALSLQPSELLVVAGWYVVHRPLQQQTEGASGDEEQRQPGQGTQPEPTPGPWHPPVLKGHGRGKPDVPAEWRTPTQRG